jgi:predicted metalloprotease
MRWRGEREGRAMGGRRRSGGGADGRAKRYVLVGVLVAWASLMLNGNCELLLGLFCTGLVEDAEFR